jgi:hypothetical protein
MIKYNFFVPQRKDLYHFFLSVKQLFLYPLNDGKYFR